MLRLRHYILAVILIFLIGMPVSAEATGLSFITKETPSGIQFYPMLPNNTRPISYYWEFGDGSISLDSTPTKYYREPGDYKVTLTVELEPSGVLTVSRVVHIGEQGALLTIINIVEPTDKGLIFWLNGEKFFYPEAALMVGGVLLVMNSYMSEQEARIYRKKGHRDAFKTWRQIEMVAGCLMLFSVMYIEVIVKGGLIY